MIELYQGFDYSCSMTLTEFASGFRRSLPYILFSLLMIIIFYFVIRSGLQFMRSRQNQGPMINAIFGPIPPPQVSNAVNYPEGVSFVLDNIEGRPTTSTDSARIYSLPAPSTRFSYLQTISLMAKAVGFNTDLVNHKLQETIAVFENDEQKLSVDINTFNFEFALEITNQNIFGVPAFPPENKIVEDARAFLTQMGKYSEELAKGNFKLTYHHYNPDTGDYEKVVDPSAANVVEVDFFKSDIEGIPVVTPKYFYSQNYVVLMYANEGSRVVKAGSTQFTPESTSGIYPVKTGDTAWQELNEGKGIIVFPGRNSEKITVREMFLAYLDVDIYQPFLQPVYVFLGDNDFVAYVGAIEESFISK